MNSSALDARVPKVCFVSHYLYPVIAQRDDLDIVGGAEVQQALITRELADRGVHVSVVSLDFGQTDGATLSGITHFVSHPKDAGWPLLRAAHPRATGIFAALRRANADIYYVRSASYLLGLVVAFCKLTGRKAVYSGASDVDFIPGQERITEKYWRKVYQWGLRHSDAVICQTENQAQDLQKNYHRTASIIPSAYKRLSPGMASVRNKEVVWCGNYRRVKRPDIFIEIARHMPDIKFRMIGGPKHASVLDAWKKTVEGLESIPNLKICGHVPLAQADAVFPEARLLVNTSDSEGFPNTFLQAWARGVPTVSFVDVGARDKDGSVCQPCGSIDGMVERIRALACNDTEWLAQSQRVAAYFEAHHSAPLSATLHLRSFQALLSRDI